MQWKGESIIEDGWGWFQKTGKYHLVRTDLPAAPNTLLRVIRCTCNQDCSTNVCGCRKNKFRCTYACGPCQTNNCCNVEMVELVEDDEEHRLLVVYSFT